ncbi:hypothetical protein SH528x_001405 [Novipirellula sp. SH528]|uniref:hypothetical protein n=1 Tax=Novipirellula sp. SH528 TaxID=3454466 RepID=UPI003F9F6CB8
MTHSGKQLLLESERIGTVAKGDCRCVSARLAQTISPRKTSRMDEENSPFLWANIPRKTVKQKDLDAKRNNYTGDHPQTLSDRSISEKGKSIFLARIMLRTPANASANRKNAPNPCL